MQLQAPWVPIPTDIQYNELLETYADSMTLPLASTHCLSLT